MSLEKWWSPDTIFITVMGGLMAVIFGASLFVRPPINKIGSALVPPSALQNARTQRVECETIKNDVDLRLHANTHC
jgi:hypothetical protein